MKNILQKAKDGGYAVGQFNITTAEQLRAVMEVAKKLNSPVIIGTSEAERDFIGQRQVVALVEAWRKETGLPILLNPDHTKSYERSKEALDLGYSSVHVDTSAMPFEDNIKTTKQVYEYAKNISSDIVVEGELGYLRGSSSLHTEKTQISEDDITKVDEAVEFVEKTGVDSLAIAIGNIHGIESSMENPPLYLDRLKEIHDAIPETCLVLHGGSGTPKEDIIKAIKLGVTKVNINTELRLAFTRGLRESLEDPKALKPYKVLAKSIEYTKKVIEEKIILLGSDNKA